ncbi:transposase [Noviherbaspirillum sedimenti]|uniref:Transposase n=1 Tax=Noviherbaspirillum sedimenti TaxID=2320865 RepID=A0A3A3GMX8_9BURK|nr:transposase [Noviherbaspirillum sedimenti]RJG02330.1 transposase [Noviherbaspirillum sedimenti]
MARLPRLVVPHQPHHVIQRGNDRQAIFRDDEDYRAFLKWLREAARQFKVALHAYVLMPNHVHLLVSPADAAGLGKMMQWIGRYYVPYFNHKYQRVGTLWQGRYRTSVIDSERYFMTCSRYIECNPARAGLVVDPARYPWSSYMHHIGVVADPYITEHPLYWSLGNTPFEREAAYKALVEQALTSEEVQALQDAADTGWALGSAQFKAGLERQVQRRVQPGKRGRPRKVVAPDAPGASGEENN